jgi:hypothetical protein
MSIGLIALIIIAVAVVFIMHSVGLRRRPSQPVAVEADREAGTSLQARGPADKDADGGRHHGCC